MIVDEGNIKDDISVKCSMCYAGKIKCAREAQVRASGPISGKLRPKGNVRASLVQEGEVRKRRGRVP